MPQYDNPAAFLADPSTMKSGTVMSGYLGALRQQQAEPFRQELLKQQQMNTQRQQTELQEFQSPQGVQERAAQRQKVIDEGDLFHETKGDKLFAAKEATRLLPYMTNQQRDEAQLHSMQSRHLMSTGPMKYMSGIFPVLEKLPEEKRAAVYDSIMKASGFDMSKFEPDLQKYGPSTMGHLAAARYAQVWTPEYQQDLGKIGAKGEQEQAVARIGVAGRIKEAGMNIAAGRFDNDQRLTASLERSIRTGVDAETGEKLTEPARQEAIKSLQRYRGSKLNDYVQKQTAEARLVHMMTMIKGTPEEKAAADQELSRQTTRAREEGMRNLGISPEDLGVTMPKPGVAKHKVGDSVTVGKDTIKILGVNQDGSYRIQGANGQTGTYRP